jgi:hypothetical protein
MNRRAALRALGIGALMIALSATVVSGAAAKSGGGNSLNAKLCQKNGWEQLVTSTGASFTSEGQCTSYAAGGGTLYTANAFHESQWQATCQGAGGTFSTDTNTWGCTGFDSYDQPTYDALAPICTAAGGSPSGEALGPGVYVLITCGF